MTREEAISLLHDMKDTYDEIHENTNYEIGYEQMTALDLAIEALTEPKIIVGIDTPYGSDKGIATLFKGKDDNLILEEVKEIMSVVRCKDCRYYDKNPTWSACTYWSGDPYEQATVDDNDFCSYGERKGGDSE